MPECNDESPWRLCPKTGPLTRALCACVALLALGLYAGGPVGRFGGALFALGAAVLGVQRFTSRPLAELSAAGVALSPGRAGALSPGRAGALSPGRAGALSPGRAGGMAFGWADVGAFVLWTAERGSARHDVLTVLTPAELPILSDALVAPISVSTLVDLSGCIVDAQELRQVIARLGATALVVDRRK